MLQKNQILKQERFRIIRQISQSENGLVYEAFDNILKTNVTLKEIFFKNNENLTVAQMEAQRIILSAEADTLIGLRHDSIVHVYDYFSEADHHYLAIENVEGNNLNELLRKGSDALTFLNVLKWSDELLNVVSYLHLQPIPLVHGNIKPENIILTSDGKVKLLPFGTLQISNTKKDSLIAERAFDVTNLHYSPLEQIWTGLDPASRKVILNNYDEKSARILEKPADAQTDIYALGATLYHLFTKSLPLDPLERSIDILEGKHDPLPAPKSINSIVLPEISDALLKAMQIKRENRFDSAASMQKVLKSALTKLQTQESLKINKYQDEDDLLGIGIVEFKPIKPVSANSDLKKSDAEADQKKQFELIKKQLQEAEAQRLKAEQRALDAEKLLLAKETKPEAELPTQSTQLSTQEIEESTIEPPDNVLTSENIELAKELSESLLPETKISDADAVHSVSSKNHSSEQFQSLLFSDPPKENRMFKRMAISAVILAALGGTGWGVFNYAKSQPIESSDTISAEMVKPPSEPEKTAAVTQSTSPNTPIDTMPASSIETLSNTQTASEINLVPSPVESTFPTETAASSQSIKNKSALPSSSRVQKQTPTPPKIAAIEKKPVTVDDIINDN